MATLLLVRHALTAETGSRLSGRLAGIELSEEGRKQASELAEELASEPVTAVYTSPILRCKQTARIVADAHDLRPVGQKSLMEVDYGTWSGRTLSSLRRTKLWKQLFIAPSRVRFPGGESLGEVQARAVAAVEQIASSAPKGHIVIVTHGDVIKTLVNHYVGAPLDLFQRISIAPASVSRVALPEHGPPYVLSVNETA